MQSMRLTALMVCVAVLTAIPSPRLAAQEDAATGAGGAANNQAIYDAYYGDVEARQAAHAGKLAAIDQQHVEAKKAFGEENARRAQALSDQYRDEHRQLADSDLVGDARADGFARLQEADKLRRQEYAAWRDATGQQLQADFLSARAAEIDRHRQEMEQLLAERNAMLGGLMNRPAQLGALGTRGDSNRLSADEQAPVNKSGATGVALFIEHCDGCHSSSPGLPGGTTIDLYEAVVVDDAAFFLDRVRNGPGPMPRIDTIQALTDSQILSIRDWVRERGDINTGAVARDGPDKLPDDAAGGSDGSGRSGGNVRAGLPPVTPDSPLPAPGPQASSAAAQEAHAQASGSAYLTCNVSADVEVRWIAPLAWRSGWIPPDGDMRSTSMPFERAWMLSLRARLEDSTQAQSNGRPSPGWCAWTSGSLGSAAGKSREISILAHTTTLPFGMFEFGGGSMQIWHTQNSSLDRGGRYTRDVFGIIQGLVMGDGQVQRNTIGTVSAQVKRIDDRWSSVGEPVFAVLH